MNIEKIMNSEKYKERAKPYTKRELDELRRKLRKKNAEILTMKEWLRLVDNLQGYEILYTLKEDLVREANRPLSDRVAEGALALAHYENGEY